MPGLWGSLLHVPQQMKTRPIRLSFKDERQQDVIALAQLGQTSDSITEHTRLTKGQVAYRIKKEKELTARKIGLRAEWRSGTSVLFQNIARDMLGVLRVDIERTLGPKTK